MSAAQNSKKLSWLIMQQGKGTIFLVSCQELTVWFISKGRCENSLWISKYHPEQFAKAVRGRQKRLWHLAGCGRKIVLLNSEFSFTSFLFFQNVDWNKKCPSHAPHDSVHLDLFKAPCLRGECCSLVWLSQPLPHSKSWVRTQKVGITSPSCQRVLCHSLQRNIV